MTRKSSNTVEYFPHFAKQGKTIFVLKSRFGNNGYALWFQLLELLCISENHYYDCREEHTWQYFLARVGVDEITGTGILNLLAKLGNIDTEMWGQRVIWCENLVANLDGVYKKRLKQPPGKPNLLYNNNVSVTEKGITGTEMPISAPEIPQSKVKYSKVNKRKDIPEYNLPDWMDRSLWDAYLEMRKAKKSPPTGRAIELILAKLTQFHNDHTDVNEVLRQSIVHNWTDVYPLKKEATSDGKGSRNTSSNTGTGKALDNSTDTERLRRSIGKPLD